MPEPFFRVTRNTFATAVAAYAGAEELRGKGIMETLVKVMTLWVSYGLSAVPAGDSARIRSWLMTKTNRHGGRGRRRSWRERITAALTEWAGIKKGSTLAPMRRGRPRAKAPDIAGTRAAAIVAALDIYHARGGTRAKFERAARTFVNRRRTSANTLRAGLIDPLRKLKGSAPRNGARFTHSPHDLDMKSREDFARICVETWASARRTPKNRRPLGIRGKAGDVFMKKMAELAATLQKWTREKLRRAALRSGLASPAPQ